jgi:hypothetical protein
MSLLLPSQNGPQPQTLLYRQTHSRLQQYSVSIFSAGSQQKEENKDEIHDGVL